MKKLFIVLLIAFCFGDKAYFNEICLKSEYDGRINAPVKWREPIRYIFNFIPGTVAEEIHLVFREMEALTGIPATYADNVNRANFIICYSPKREFINVLVGHRVVASPDVIRRNLNGLFLLERRNQVTIKRAFIWIDSTEPYSISRHVLREEITQAYGLINDSMRFKDSIFYQFPSKTYRYSKEDKYIIRKLYSDNY